MSETGAWSETWYAATAPAPAFTPLDGDRRVGACVVGGGLTGVSAALELADRGIDTVLVEGDRLGHGASGRNGGHLCTGFGCGIDRIESLVDATTARELWDLAQEGMALLRGRVERYAIDCDLSWGYLHAAVRPAHLRDMEKDSAHLAERYGYTATRVVGAEEMRTLVDTDAYCGGMIEDDAGQIHPLKYLHGLAAAARAAGVTLSEETPATAVETPAGAPPRVVTPRGTVTADHVILCCNAYIGRLVPSIAGRLMRVASAMGATAPLSANRAATLIRDARAVADSNIVLNYFRVTPDHRLLFGCGARYDGRAPRDPGHYVRGRLRRVFPQLADLPLDYAWSGFIGITRTRFPHIARVAPGVYVAQGYAGQGLVISGLAGRVVAEAVAGTASRLDLFEGLAPPAFPGGPLRTAALVAAMAWFRLRDRIA